MAFPTETVYGLGANGLNEDAVKKIFIAKGRPSNNPLILHLPSKQNVWKYWEKPTNKTVFDYFEKLSALWPGPLTIILPSLPSVPNIVRANLKTVAIRIPVHPIALLLLNGVDFPIAAPSANISNYVSPTTAEHVESGLGDRIDMILDGGPSNKGLESTIITLADSVPRILRSGSITAEEISEILNIPLPLLIRKHNDVTPLSPGMISEHYAPKTRLIFWNQFDTTLKGNFCFIGFSNESAKKIATNFSETIVLSSTGNLEEVAMKFFATLREMDQKGFDLLVIDTCEDAGIGRAIMDRLRKATATL